MYQLFQPAKWLRPYIECYWIVDADLHADAPLRELIFVDGKADLIFNFGDAYQRDADAIAATNLDAQRAHPVSIAQYGHIQLIGVRFRPGGLAQVTDVPMHDLSSQVLEPQHCFGSDVRILEGQLYDNVGAADVQRALLDTFFMRRACDVATSAYARAVAHMIEAHQGNLDLSDLSTETGYSLRTLNRFFNAGYGFPIKFYARVMRFHAAQNALLGVQSLARIALDCGYYDQSHFTREFKAFTGFAPSQYRGYLRAKSAAAPPNLVQFLQDVDPELS